MSPQIYVDLTLMTLLFFASVYDLAQRRIPNRLLGLGLIGALVLHLLYSTAWTLVTSMLAGFAVGLCMFLPLYLARAMAAGDVKLMATVGAYTGPVLALEISLATYCMGGVLALLIVLWRGQVRQAAVNVVGVMRPLIMRLVGVPLATEPFVGGSVGSMPYALAITAGTLLMLWIRHT